MLKGIGSENPALKWTQRVISPVITPILHSWVSHIIIFQDTTNSVLHFAEYMLFFCRNRNNKFWMCFKYELIYFSLDIGCVVAPTLYIDGVLVCGPSVEMNLLSDCTVELSLAHLVLLRRLMADMTEAIKNR